jgi:hypothetical protein
MMAWTRKLADQLIQHLVGFQQVDKANKSDARENCVHPPLRHRLLLWFDT